MCNECPLFKQRKTRKSEGLKRAAEWGKNHWPLPATHAAATVISLKKKISTDIFIPVSALVAEGVTICDETGNSITDGYNLDAYQWCEK